jgi:hypothetical protein
MIDSRFRWPLLAGASNDPASDAMASDIGKR